MDALVSFLSPGGLAIVTALLVMGIEAWLSRPDPIGFVRSLRQPSWALPLAATVAIPLAFYGIATFAAAAALRAGDVGRGAFALTVAVLIGNAVLNHLLCRRQRIDWAFRLSIPIALLAAAAACVVFTLDARAGLLMGLVAAFLVYDVAWLGALARLNPVHTGRPSA